MFCLYASGFNATPNPDGGAFIEKYSDLVKVFETEDDAISFAESCRLKQIVRNVWRNNTVFKKNTLLANYDEYWVVEEKNLDELLKYRKEN